MKGAKPATSNVVPMVGDLVRAVPDAPSFMSEEGRKVWDHLAPIMIAKKRLEPEFEQMFAAYCEAVGDFERMTGDIAMMGSYFETKTRNGVQEKHRAAWRQRQEALANMRQIGALFGLSPVDEQRVGSGGQGDLLARLAAELNGTD